MHLLHLGPVRKPFILNSVHACCYLQTPLSSGSQSLNDAASPILYPRYTNLSQILLPPSETAKASAFATVATQHEPAAKRTRPTPSPATRTTWAPVSPAPPPAAAAVAELPVLNLHDGAAEAPPRPLEEAKEGTPGAGKVRTKPRWTDEKKEAAKEQRAAARKLRREQQKLAHAAGQAAHAQPEGEGLSAEGSDAIPAPDLMAIEGGAAPEQGAGAAAVVAVPVQAVGKEERRKGDKLSKKALAAARKLAPGERVSGPSNADEARKIREALGEWHILEKCVVMSFAVADAKARWCIFAWVEGSVGLRTLILVLAAHSS
jgi:hypothetical protein